MVKVGETVTELEEGNRVRESGKGFAEGRDEGDADLLYGLSAHALGALSF